jgi:hypothetical protein
MSKCSKSKSGFNWPPPAGALVEAGARLDPNRPDDPEYIVRLLAQVIRLSLDTLAILRSLPAWHV